MADYRARVGGWLVALLATASVAVTGCAQLPTSGPIDRGDQVQAAADDPVIRLLPRPPVAGASPEEIVGGFLSASASFENDHAVARLYLTASAAARWDPGSGVTVVEDVPGYELARQARDVVLSARQVGRIGGDGALTPEASLPIQRRFHLARVEGEWRISQAPQGLLLNQFDVDRVYGAFNTFFLNPARSLLVPDPVYIPLEQAGSATSLVRTLLDGPTRWLHPAVESAIPGGTSLVVGSVPVENGVAQVDLSTEFLTAGAQERELASAQVTMTLLQVPEITGVTISVEGSPLQLPTAPPVMDDSTWSAYDADALTPVLGALYVRGGTVRSGAGEGTGRGLPVDGPLGSAELDVRSPSQSWDGSVLTGLSTDRRTLWVTLPHLSADVVRQRSGRALLPASIDGADDVWAVDAGRRSPAAWAWRSVGGERWTPVELPHLDGRLTAFRVSVDATRVAVVVSDAYGRGHLLLGRIVQGRSEVRVEALRPIELTLVDVGAITWVGADRLVVVGGTRGSTLEPTTVYVNGTVEPVAGTSLASIVTITGAPDEPLLAASDDHQIAEHEETGWRTVGPGQDPAYPG